jgi:hypothetical protein
MFCKQQRDYFCTENDTNWSRLSRLVNNESLSRCDEISQTES